jgi:hypothetical protein
MRRDRAFHRFTQWCLYRGGLWWRWDLSWLATTWIGALQQRRAMPWAEAIFEAYLAGAWMLYWTSDTLYWIAKPTVSVERVNEHRRRRLHHATGPALGCDIEDLYFWHGVFVPAHVVLARDQITLAEIQTERNAEVRRVLLERFGFDRYVSESGAIPIHADATGTLYRCDVPDDEPLMVVRVTNSSPEPDGTFKHYVLRVDPELRPLLADGTTGDPQALTAHNAVASTFGLTGSAYAPVVET